MDNMKSYIRYILAFAFLCSVCVLNAQTISKDEALTKAKQFINANSPATRSANDAQYEAVDIAQHLYVFNISNGGYVIVSSEPTSESIIGYSLSGKIDKNNIPDNMKVMLQGYENEIKASINNPKPLSRSVDAKPVYKTPIEPIVKVKWNQWSPYNMFCPKVDGERPPTGCVPTAMAQVMGHYKWPEKGHGMLYHSHWEHGYYGEQIKDSINLDTTPIDWKNICDTYTGRETQVQKEAVAMLIKMCGFACGVAYGIDGSGAGGGAPGRALKDYFYYKVSSTTYSAFWGDLTAAYNFFYKNLKEGKPIICSLNGWGNPGHEVVVDGCDKNGFLHINFGWAGSSDGYFQMNVAKHAGGYTFGSFDNIIVAEPDYEMKGESNITYTVTSFSVKNNNWETIYSMENAEDDWVEFGIDIFEEPRNIDFGLRISISDKENKFINIFFLDENCSIIDRTNLDEYGGIKIKNLIELASKLGLNKGKYKCYPAYKKDNEWYDYRIKSLVSPLYINLIVKDDGSIVFTTPDVRNTSFKVEDKTICIEENCMNADVHIFNTYGLCVFSGREDKIKVPSAGIYTVKIGQNFYKTLIVK